MIWDTVYQLTSYFCPIFWKLAVTTTWLLKYNLSCIYGFSMTESRVVCTYGWVAVFHWCKKYIMECNPLEFIFPPVTICTLSLGVSCMSVTTLLFIENISNFNYRGVFLWHSQQSLFCHSRWPGIIESNNIWHTLVVKKHSCSSQIWFIGGIVLIMWMCLNILS